MLAARVRSVVAIACFSCVAIGCGDEGRPPVGELGSAPVLPPGLSVGGGSRGGSAGGSGAAVNEGNAGGGDEAGGRAGTGGAGAGEGADTQPGADVSQPPPGFGGSVDFGRGTGWYAPAAGGGGRQSTGAQPTAPTVIINM